MLLRAALCPHPPLLLPEVAAGAAVERADLRSACLLAVSELLAAGPDAVVVVGDAPTTTAFGPGSWGSLAPFGVRRSVQLPGAVREPTPRLPLSLIVGGWLLERAGWAGPTRGCGVPDRNSPAAAARTGRRLVAGAERIGLLVMGDGTARRSEKAPGYLDPRAAGFDAEVARALAAADATALLALDPALATELLATGRASWQVLAGAAGDGHWQSRVSYDDAPYGVSYLVAQWWPR